MEFKEETPCLHGLTGVGTPALRATAGAAVNAGLSETPHPSLQEEEALSPVQRQPWRYHVLTPVVAAAADTRRGITSTPAHHLFQRSPMCTFHLILKITCF